MSHGYKREVRPGVWYLRVSHGTRRDGSRRQVNETFHGDEAHAQARCDELWMQLGGKPNLGMGVTLDQYFRRVFVPTRSTYLAKKTMARYVQVYEDHIAPTFADEDVSTISRSDVQAWVMSFDSPSTAREAFSRLRAILRAAYDDELLDERPLERRVVLPRFEREHKATWTASEVLEASRRLRGDRFEAMFIVMASTGMRRGEALALEWPDDFSFSSDGSVVDVSVTKSLTPIDGMSYTKTRRSRMVRVVGPMATRLMEVLCDMGPGRVIRPKRGGHEMMPRGTTRAWTRLFEDGMPLHGMRYIELESLRHTNVTLAVLGGASDTASSIFHGHSERVAYSHYIGRDERAADSVAYAFMSSVEEARRSTSFKEDKDGHA